MEIISIHMFNSGIYWGILILILGLVLIIKQLFNLDFPVGKVMIGVFLISLGIKLLFFQTPTHTHFSHSDDNSVVFGNKDMQYNEDQFEYNVVFSSSTIDLRDIEVSPSNTIEINSVFGDTKVLLSETIKVDINSDAVFGAVHNPSPENKQDKDSNFVEVVQIKIQASAVFGNISFVRD